MAARVNWIDKARSLLRQGGDLRIEADVPLAGRTYLGVGGPAPVLVIPSSVEALAGALERLSGESVPFDVLGAGSNLLVADSGPSFVVFASESLSGEPRIAGSSVQVGAGFSMPRLVARLQKEGLSGLEFAEGIPGSVGGCVRMNAGWHDGEVGRSVASVTAVTRDGLIEEIDTAAGTFAYRSSPGLGERFIAAARFRLTPDDPQAIAARIHGFRDHRVATQPTGARNAGCMFKNPPGDHAGRLIDACGLKGRTIGGAQVSEVHANFIINRGGASYGDIVALIDAMRETVHRETGITLEREVKLWQ